ncbi:MAG: hypothetical protein JSW28_06735 [Thermoplasmata archaeon]|nr:MAG: hypothetical protein JSW28_06735 [Thermoplasmata archaeon]
MDNGIVEMGRLLYKEKGNDRKVGFFILILAFVMSFMWYLVYLIFILALDNVITEIDIYEEFSWVPILAFILIPATVYVYSVHSILTGKGPLKIYERGIEIRSALLKGSQNRKTFIPFEEIERINILYAGGHRKILKEYLNELYYSGIRIITKDGQTHDISSTMSTARLRDLTFFKYDLVQIFQRRMGINWDKSFSIKPEITDREWDDIYRLNTDYFYSVEGYALKQFMIMVMLMIPVTIILVLMSQEIVEPWIILIPLSIAFGYIPYLSDGLFEHMEDIMVLLGSLFRAQEYEIITGEKIIPSRIEIPDKYVYPEKDWPEVREEFWRDVEEIIAPKSILKESMHSQAYRIIIYTKLDNYLRYERLAKKKIIPQRIRQMEEVRKFIEKGRGDIDDPSKLLKPREKKRLKIFKLFEALEEGEPIAPDFDFRPVCFKEYR